MSEEKVITTVRMSKELNKRVRQFALDKGVSANAVMEEAVIQYLNVRNAG